MDAKHNRTLPGLAAPEVAHDGHVEHVPLGTTAAHAVVMHTNEKGPDAANVGARVQLNQQDDIFEEHNGDSKQFATLRAQLALAGGYALLELTEGSYLVRRWDFC